VEETGTGQWDPLSTKFYSEGAPVLTWHKKTKAAPFLGYYFLIYKMIPFVREAYKGNLNCNAHSVRPPEGQVSGS
jgi:hypothetical protein